MFFLLLTYLDDPVSEATAKFAKVIELFNSTSCMKFYNDVQKLAKRNITKQISVASLSIAHALIMMTAVQTYETDSAG